MMTSFSIDPELRGPLQTIFRARGPAKPFLLFFRLFRIGWFPPVVLRHRRVDALGQDHLHCVPSFADHFRRCFQLRFLHRPQHVFFAAAQRMIRSATQPQPCKFLCADRADHGLRAVVASCAALRMNPDRAPRQLRFVPQHQQILHRQFVLCEQLPHGDAAEIHVRLRLRQDHFFPGNLTPAHQRLALGPFHANPAAIRKFIHRHKTQVMRRPLILRIGIPKSDNEPHRPFSRSLLNAGPLLHYEHYFFFSPLSLFSALGLASASAPSSPSTSFLPFLMTSGSAGVAASAATASAGFSSSTFSATTCASTRSGSVINFILVVSSGNSLARSCAFSIRPLTSTLNSVGISAGKHSISTSRVTTSKTPPCTFTPEGSPNVCTGTFTFIRTSMATRRRSTCSNFPVMGSTSQSFRIAGSCFPPRST